MATGRTVAAPYQAGSSKKPGNGANLGFEEKLWAAADKMRGHMDPAEYKHVVLGLVFLKYISDAFTSRHEQLELWTADPSSDYFLKEEQARYSVLEDRDEYLAENVFWVPPEARWSFLQANAKQPSIGKLKVCATAQRQAEAAPLWLAAQRSWDGSRGSRQCR